MLKKLATLVGLGVAAGVAAQTTAYTPYRDSSTNTIYNLLFGDDLALFKASHQGAVEGPWKTLFAQPADREGLQALAANATEEARLRILASNALRKLSVPTQRKELLGVIVEVGLDGGLDTLAAYQDGRARYINQSGKMVVWEATAPDVDSKIRQLFRASQVAVDKLGPWDKPRLAPPPSGAMRLTFLVSDGLYFGQGPMADLQNDPMGGPVVTAATELMVALTRKVRPD